MKILYDHQIFCFQRVGGISRYFFELLIRLSTYENIKEIISLGITNNEYMLSYAEIKKLNIKRLPDPHSFLKQYNFKGKKLLFKIAERVIPDLYKRNANYLLSIECLKKQEFDLFHPTYYNPYFLEYIGRKPFVITAYDCINETLSKNFSNTNSEFAWKSILFEKAAKIIAISWNTKKDIVKFYKVDEKKIEVIYLATSMNNIEIAKPLQQLPSKYLLYVGDRKRYKNFLKFLRSLKPIFEKNNELNLVCAGSDFTKDERAIIQEYRMSGKVFQLFASDNELKYLYSNAIAFVFPSMYEGFGIPILEAFSCGCPAIISDGSSMNEVGGDAAYYFNPMDELSITEAISHVLNDDTLRKNMIERGYKRVSDFSWKKNVKKTIQFYNEVCSK